MSIAAAHLGMTDFADATPRTAIPSGATIPRPGANTSFEPLKQINAGLLNVGYAEAGPANGPAVILLQGWPYDIHSYVDVAPLLASAGYRVIVPHLRGFARRAFFPVTRSAMASRRQLRSALSAHPAKRTNRRPNLRDRIPRSRRSRP